MRSVTYVSEHFVTHVSGLYTWMCLRRPAEYSVLS